MKKLINRPEAVVEEMVEGLVAVYPGLRRLPGKTVVVRNDDGAAKRERVALISGGGSGHEPAHAGYVGKGMLDAAVAGDVFTSPPPDAVLAALRAVTGPAGALVIVKNYTGDRLNFGLAAELARSEGLKVEVVVVADDVALAGATTENAGRRGLAGTVLVHKIAGAAAEAGADLYEVAAEARGAAEAVATMGVALSACTIPAAGKPGFELGPQEIELGLGIHGEPGARRGTLELADVLTDRLLAAIVAEQRLAPGERVALLVNGLGGTPPLELAIVARRAIEKLEARGVVVERVYCGTFLSALEMAGVSLSVLRVDDLRLSRLDATTDAPAWPNPGASTRPRVRGVSAFPAAVAPQAATPVAPLDGPATPLGRALSAAMRAGAEALRGDAARLTDLDRAVGDGDLGISLDRGAQAVLDALPALPLDDPAAALHSLSLTLQAALGGTSGPLYSVFFLRASNRLKAAGVDRRADPVAWVDAFRAGCDGIIELGGAGRGDRTMLDALLPALDALTDALNAHSLVSTALTVAAEAADHGALATADLHPRRGRSSYLGARALGHVDPGATAVAVWLRAVAGCIAGG